MYHIAYIVDTNIILQDVNIIDKLLAEHPENKVFIPYRVLYELDNIKKQNKNGQKALVKIYAYFKENYTATDIGKQLGVSQQAVDKRLKNILKKLKEELVIE